jgi:hypothetical protein
MRTSLGAEIRDQIRSYLAGDKSLRDFQEWFVPATWDVERTDTEAAALAYSIDLWLAEYTSNHRTKEDLDTFLTNLVRSEESAKLEAKSRQ